ncbi:MAG: prenyltransferase/squalene oxidase repeat-containing protein [Candidatus Hodarchaeota archaeon]
MLIRDIFLQLGKGAAQNPIWRKLIRGLIILLLVMLNPCLIREASKTTVANHEPEMLRVAENTPRLVDNSTTISWIKSHQKKNGGYGRLDNFWSHGSWTYAAVHALTLLNKTRTDNRLTLPENTYDTMIYVQSLGMGNGYLVPYRTNFHAFENIYTLNLLGYESFNKQSIVQKLFQANLTLLADTDWYDRSIEEIYYTVAALKLLGVADRANLGDIVGLVNWLKSFQNSDGGWDNIGSDNDPDNLDGTSYVTFTLYAAMTLSYLNVTIPNNDTLVKFIQSCQNSDGGFGNRPDGLGSISDVYYTFTAIQTLAIFDKQPIDVNGAIRWLNRLQNYDGGFGDKPQWNSRLYSTYYAIHSLIMLKGTIYEKIRQPPKSYPIPTTHHVFSYGMEVSGYSEQFSSESVSIANDLGLDLIGIKTRYKLQSTRANEFAEYYNLSTRTVLNPEFHGEKIDVNGLGRFSHVADILYPPDGDSGGVGGTMEWQDYKNRIKRGHEAGALYFIGSHTRDFDYLIIDDSLESHSGYDIITGGSSHGEAVRQFPWFERWIGKLPMVANSDAHQEFWNTRKQFKTVRTLFIAPNSTWEGFKEAVFKNRVVVSFKTADTTGFDDVVLYGATEAINHLLDHGNEWIWWGSHDFIFKVLIIPITHGSSVVPDNSYEWDLGNFTGTILRIKNDTQFESFKLDGQQLNNLTFVNRTSSHTLSSFFYVHLERISNGTHVAEVEYVSQDNLKFVKTVIFDVEYSSLYLHELAHFPADTTKQGSIIVKVTAIERVPAKHVILWYSLDEKATWNSVNMSKGENTVYTAIIEKVPPDRAVYYYVEAIDKIGNSFRLPRNKMNFATFVVSYQRTAEEYIYIFIFSVIPIVGIISLLTEFLWNRKVRKHS